MVEDWSGPRRSAPPPLASHTEKPSKWKLPHVDSSFEQQLKHTWTVILHSGRKLKPSICFTRLCNNMAKKNSQKGTYVLLNLLKAK